LELKSKTSNLDTNLSLVFVKETTLETFWNSKNSDSVPTSEIRRKNYSQDET